MDVRPATTDDVKAVLPMVDKIAAMHKKMDPAKYGYLDDVAGMYDGWLQDRADDPRSVFLVADTGEKLAGFLIGTVEHEIPIYHLEEYGFIHDLWVEDDYRHEGVGRQLVTLALERFKSIRVEQVRCDTASGNTVARSLFERCGFQPSTVEMLIEL
jgi:ribosomal protein S18 acetylase RimI-like enzyme